MTKQPDITPITTSYSSQETLNENFENVGQAFNNTLSRDGSTPNNMEADLDMDGNDVINAGTLSAKNLTLNGQTVVSTASVPNWRGNWQPGVQYLVNDITRVGGSSYICVVEHTSNAEFPNDFITNKWEIFARQGDPGSGTGDMLAANNLSEVDPSAARANIGLGSAAVENTTSFATAAQGLLASTSLQPSIIVDEDDMSSNSNLLIPTQQSVKSYVDSQTNNFSFDYTEIGIFNNSSIIFQNIPPGVTEMVLIMRAVVSTAQDLSVRIGHGNEIQLTNYTSTAGRTSGTASVNHVNSFASFTSLVFNNSVMYGAWRFNTVGENRWHCDHQLRSSENSVTHGSGFCNLANTLNRVQVLAPSGTLSSGILYLGVR